MGSSPWTLRGELGSRKRQCTLQRDCRWQGLQVTAQPLATGLPCAAVPCPAMVRLLSSLTLHDTPVAPELGAVTGALAELSMAELSESQGREKATVRRFPGAKDDLAGGWRIQVGQAVEAEGMQSFPVAFWLPWALNEKSQPGSLIPVLPSLPRAITSHSEASSHASLHNLGWDSSPQAGHRVPQGRPLRQQHSQAGSHHWSLPLCWPPGSGVAGGRGKGLPPAPLSWVPLCTWALLFVLSSPELCSGKVTQLSIGKVTSDLIPLVPVVSQGLSSQISKPRVLLPLRYLSVVFRGSHGAHRSTCVGGWTHSRVPLPPQPSPGALARCTQ